ncbi:MAG: archease [Candidatus Eisenbacteria bacterium]|uniref:Archease n=1 Tax=Eiseniibacteriota bacterium TaxID=2212470 RepID=A0A948RZ39_UNCEI|nr:archease [Candidatus Eisenbacteria bacterium]MBU1948341.1 archease [Candidatus Eisenbacteria bacterium]MBU2692234.1 archease [Candidatus Eisenbacteria bacterium]
MTDFEPENDATGDPAAGWEVMDHTADIGLRVWAPTLEGLFEQAAEGVASLSVDITRIDPLVQRRVEVEGWDLEELLVSWLQEFLYLWSGSGFIGRRFQVRILPPSKQEPGEQDPEKADVEKAGVENVWRLEGVITGEMWDPGRHEAYTDIKAATYHNLKIRSENPAGGKIIYRVALILDT